MRERYKLLCIKLSAVVPFNIVYEGEADEEGSLYNVV